jgi:hypothetical protein
MGDAMPARPPRLPRLATFTVLACVSALGSLPPAPARAQDQHPPACSDERWIKSVKRQYDDAEEIIKHSGLKIKEIKEVKETYYGAAPKSFNQYANSNDHVLNVRWCQATLVLSDGQGDTLYWYLADELQGEKHSTPYDHCSPKHSFDATCAEYREHK